MTVQAPRIVDYFGKRESLGAIKSGLRVAPHPIARNNLRTREMVKILHRFWSIGIWGAVSIGSRRMKLNLKKLNRLIEPVSKINYNGFWDESGLMMKFTS